MMTNKPSNPVRRFDVSKHLIPLFDEFRAVPLRLENGDPIPGITGVAGATEITMLSNEEIGVDYIKMDPGTEFPLHIHPGDHILVFLEGKALVHINGTDWVMEPGTSIFIPGEYPHGVKSYPGSAVPMRFIAFGHPHKAIGGTDRMKRVNAEDYASENPYAFEPGQTDGHTH